MKRSSIVWQFALLAAVGCSGQSGPVAVSPSATEPTAAVQTEAVQTETAQEGETAITFVSLKVPNMV